jgi:hypothetical protein
MLARPESELISILTKGHGIIRVIKDTGGEKSGALLTRSHDP